MLNVFRNSEGDYTTRVALPVNKRLPDEGDIQFKWMLGNGNILTTDIKGGPAQIQKAFDQMQNFIDDNRRTAPAIEFQSLINRPKGRAGYEQVGDETVLAGDVTSPQPSPNKLYFQFPSPSVEGGEAG